MTKDKPDLVYGTLDMLILKALQHDPRHGLAIADRIQQMSKEILHVEQGSLYPALYRLEAQGWIKAERGVSDNNRDRKSTRLNSSHSQISYAVFCLKKKKNMQSEFYESESVY